MNGYIYDSRFSRYFFGIVSLCLLVRCYRKRREIDYYWINYLVVSLTILLVYLLYKLDIVSLYYFYKLFYLDWFFVVIFIGNLFMKKREFFYTIFTFIIIGISLIFVLPDNSFYTFLTESNVIGWNADSFNDDEVILTSNELELINESIKYSDICVYNKEFLISGEKIKNPWIYSITNNVPLYDWENGFSSHLGNDNIRFDFWLDLDEYQCLIYFYEDDKKVIDKDSLEVLFSNADGIVLKKK